MHEGFGFLGGGLMWIFWLLLFLVIAWVIRAAVGGGGGPSPRSGSSPMEILRERYARGEIDRDTFEQMKKDLEA